MRLGTAAILWTNNIGPPLESQLPWQFLSELVIHGLGLPLCGVTPYKHSKGSPLIAKEVTLHAVALLVTMAGRFFKAGRLDSRHITHLQQWIMPILSATFALYHQDPEIGGVLVILAALAVGQRHMTLGQHISLSEEIVRAGKSSYALCIFLELFC